MTGEGGHYEPRFFVCEAVSVFRVLGLLRCAHDVGFTPRNSQKRRFNATFQAFYHRKVIFSQYPKVIFAPIPLVKP